MTKLEYLQIVLKNLGGKASLSEIYKEFERVTGEHLTPNTKAGIRKTIEVNSSDSEAYNQKSDIFYSVEGIGKGVWGLRNFD